MKKFKHSGTFGDLIYSLPIVKHFGGGEFYLHLNQIDWIGMHYYRSKPTSFHQGRLTEDDFEFMRDFMLAQSYITKFDRMDNTVEITHNLDRFRKPFVGHPGNYVDIYADCFGISDQQTKATLRNTAWLTVPEPKKFEGKSIVVNRTARWLPLQNGAEWTKWKLEGLDKKAVFVGLPAEYHEFCFSTGWEIDYYPTTTMLDLAACIAGADLFIGNQSVALSLAIGLGTKFRCERRQDLPLERNECWFKDHPKGNYF